MLLLEDKDTQCSLSIQSIQVGVEEIVLQCIKALYLDSISTAGWESGYTLDRLPVCRSLT